MVSRYRSHSAFTGAYLRVNLEVAPIEKYSPICELEFTGYSFIQSGDKIRAEIKKYQEVDRKLRLTLLPNKKKLDKYEEREFREKESVSLIQKLGQNNEILATFRGLD